MRILLKRPENQKGAFPTPFPLWQSSSLLDILTARNCFLLGIPSLQSFLSPVPFSSSFSGSFSLLLSLFQFFIFSAQTTTIGEHRKSAPPPHVSNHDRIRELLNGISSNFIFWNFIKIYYEILILIKIRQS